MTNPASYLKIFHTEDQSMLWPPLIFFRNSPHILALGSKKVHGNMQVSGGTVGNSNRRIFIDDHVYPGAVIFPARVVHENRVVVVSRRFPRPLDGVDGLITTEEEAYLGMPFADCPTIILSGFTSWRKPIVALIHAGYKPLLKEIIFATVIKMSEECADLETIQAFIGPAICKRCYIFGPEAPRVFRGYKRYLARIAGTGEYLVDLIGIIRIKLERAGIRDQNIFSSSLCTYESPFLFSARREKMHPVLNPQNPVKSCMVFAGIKKVA